MNTTANVPNGTTFSQTATHFSFFSSIAVAAAAATFAVAIIHLILENHSTVCVFVCLCARYLQWRVVGVEGRMDGEQKIHFGEFLKLINALMKHIFGRKGESKTSKYAIIMIISNPDDAFCFINLIRFR